jgi:transposase
MNPAFVLMRCKAEPGASRGGHRLLRCPASDSRSRPLPPSMPKAPFWFATYKGGMSAELFIAMLKQIMRRRRRPVFLVLDSPPAHKAKVVRDYVDATDGKLKMYFLPGYAPELNPDELVWSHMKRTGTSKRPLASNELLQERIEADLINIKNNRTLVRSFFDG